MNPSSTDSDKPKTWVDILEQEYAEGADDIEVMAALGLSRADFMNYYESEPSFKEYVDIGRMKSSAFWRRVARKHLFNKSLNVPVWTFVMKNREGWAEKSESVVNDVPANQKSLDELRTQIMAELPELKEKLGIDDKFSDLVFLDKSNVK
jgi:hypothetical protein